MTSSHGLRFTTPRTALFCLSIVFVACMRPDSRSGTEASASSTATVATPVEKAPSKPMPCDDGTISEEGVGELSIGDAVDAARKCRVVRDTTVPADEGMSARKLFVIIGRDTVAAEIVENRVWRIEVLSPGPRTADSLGVGTPLSQLLRLRNPRGITGEGRMFVVSSDHCGLSFQLSPPGPAAHRGEWDRNALSKLPSSTVVSRVLVIGCGGSKSSPAKG